MPEVQQPFISVVVPTYNRSSSLRRLLSALERQTYPTERFEVLVVDDGSTDGTQQSLRELKLPYALRLVEQEHDGPAAARNHGVAAARGELIVFLDDDVVPLPELLNEHALTHGSASDLVVIGPMSPPKNWHRPAWVRWEEDLLQIQYRDMMEGKYPCTPRQLYTANASMRRERFLAVGGFDTSFKRAEDVELGYRLRDAGARFIFNPHADVMHYASRTFAAWLRTPYLYGRYDVVMAHDKDQDTLLWATVEFHGRNPLTRALVRLAVGRPRIVSAARTTLRAAVAVAEHVHLRRQWSGYILSAIFNLMYWQGVNQELGGRRAVLDALRAGADIVEMPPVVAEPMPVVSR
jgi:GT2 family glycosyltransferase